MNYQNNRLESEGTDTESSKNSLRTQHSNRTVLLGLMLLAWCTVSSAYEIHLFSNQDNGVVGIVTSDTQQPFFIEGVIENNILEAIEVSRTGQTEDSAEGGKNSVLDMNVYANSDGTGKNGPANSDGTGNTGPANSDGTGDSANSDGTGSPENILANSDGTGKVMSVLLNCEGNDQHVGLLESSEASESVVINQVYYNGSLYSCG